MQYFERARFEWRPELPFESQVQLGHLGREYLPAVPPAPGWALAAVQTAEHAWNGVRPTRIRMPRSELDTETEIVEGGFSLGGWDAPRYIAVHYWPVSGFPGTRGNIMIAGHIAYKDTIFNHLPEAVVGDVIVLSVGGGERQYQVTNIWTALPTDTWVMAPMQDEVLTLITCVPLGAYSSVPHRVML